MKNIIITNALPYANGNLHLGHMFGYVKSDIWTRMQRKLGNKCHFICGSDTHGTPIMILANKLKKDASEMVKCIAKSHYKDFKNFNISFDHYHSTNNKINEKLTISIFNVLKEKKIIKYETIKQIYDPKEKMFLPDRFITGECPKCNSKNQYSDGCEKCGAIYQSQDIINPQSTINKNKLILKKTEHIFFEINKFEKSIKKYIENNQNLQIEIKNKIKEWFNNKIQNWCISRDKPYFGFHIPNTNPKKYFYVWIDATIGYLAAFKCYCKKNHLNYKEIWQNNKNTEIHHFIGKDIIYFHAICWTSILKAIKYRMPTSINVNGFLTINKRKMSKSKGTLILAKKIIKYIEVDYLRYYFATKIDNTIKDIDINIDELIKKINSEIIGKIINIASRSFHFINKYFDNTLSENIIKNNITKDLKKIHKKITHLFKNHKVKSAIKIIINIAENTNKIIEEYKPWKIINIKRIKVQEICSFAINIFKIIMEYLNPIMPKIYQKSCKILNIKENDKWDNNITFLKNHKINNFEKIAERINKEKISKIIKKN